ncbi:hypothetical protein [Roseateles amylovorans]|uniref:Uncharacterized protein n=1 Tax=Roseateles amylovorans TaxID=2978473 RepID=A0ABY6ATR7_9BURK|nr:hypothetical protein [Roseateles amylovorans]UXH76616.1 hypothetical protein N4261_16390 [Roseateles amylovorans]
MTRTDPFSAAPQPASASACADAARRTAAGRAAQPAGRPARALATIAAIALTSVLAMGLTGCSEGYPAEDLAQLSPFDMSNAQRLRALNEISTQAHRSERARFVLEPDCRLVVARESKSKTRSAPRTSHTYALRRAMDAGVFFNETDRSFEVHLLASADPGAARLGVLLKSASWTHATQADLLVQLVIRDCKNGSATTAQPLRDGATGDL